MMRNCSCGLHPSAADAEAILTPGSPSQLATLILLSSPTPPCWKWGDTAAGHCDRTRRRSANGCAGRGNPDRRLRLGQFTGRVAVVHVQGLRPKRGGAFGLSHGCYHGPASLDARGIK